MALQCPDELNAALENFVDYYNGERCHQSLDNVTRAHVFYYGKREQILERREKIKRQSLLQRTKIYSQGKSNI